MTLKYIGVFLLIVGFLSIIPLNVAGQGSLSLSIDRNVGMALGSLIQGSFTLRGSGPENVQNLTVYFNGDVVQFVTGNTISWQFNTEDYPSGSTNITLLGLDSTGAQYVATRQLTFIGGIVSTAITVGVLALVVTALFVKYRSRLMKKPSPRQI